MKKKPLKAKPRLSRIQEEINKREQIELLEQKLIELKSLDPFWFFEPSAGVITPKQKRFLLKYLKPDDIPLKLDSQLDALLSTADVLGISGANQSGKTTIGVIRGIIKSIGEIPVFLERYKDKFKSDIERAKKKFIRGRVVGVDYKSLHNTLLPAWRYWCPKSFLLNGKWSDSFSSQHNLLTLYRNGKPCASVEFMTNTQEVDSFAGAPLDWLGYDEEPREEIHKENLMRFTTADRLDIGFYWTPVNGLSWATDLFSNPELSKQNVELYKICSVSNPKANLETLEEILKGVDNYDMLKVRLLGEFISLSGLVYGNTFTPSIHVIEPFFESLPDIRKKEYLTLFGIDPHLVTPTAMVFVLIDKENIAYVDRCYFKDVDTDVIKSDFWSIVDGNKYRVGWGVADKSSDSSIIAFGGLNIFQELKRPLLIKNNNNIDNVDVYQTKIKGIPGLRTSEKFEGSIKAGVNEIKKRLKNRQLFVVNRPENRELIQSFRTLERDTYANEEKSGMKDRIREGKHHLHAALRYVFQFPVRHYPEVINVPTYQFMDEGALL